jgi:hypothetical protein
MADAGSHGHEAGPRAKLMQEVAEEMDSIEADFGDDFEIGRVITIVEVKQGDDVNLRVRAGQFPWVAMGMLYAALESLKAQMAGGGEQ